MLRSLLISYIAQGTMDCRPAWSADVLLYEEKISYDTCAVLDIFGDAYVYAKMFLGSLYHMISGYVCEKG